MPFLALVLAALASLQDAAPGAEWRGLAVDELIARLPASGTEWTWDERARERHQHGASQELLRRLAGGAVLTTEQWRAALLAPGVVRMRSKWPADRPLAISMRIPAWLPATRVTLRSRQSRLASASVKAPLPGGCGLCDSGGVDAAFCQELGFLPLGVHDVDFGVDVVAGAFHSILGLPDSPLLAIGGVWSGSLPYRVEIVPTIDDAIPAVSSPELDAAVRDSIGIAFEDWWFQGGERRTALVVVDPDVRTHPILAGVALSLQVEIVHKGKVKAEVGLLASARDPLALANSVSTGDAKSIAFEPARPIPRRLETQPAAREGWTLRVRGTSEHVETVWESTRRWGGRIEIPVDDAIRRERERAGPAGRGPWVWTPRSR